MKQKRLKIVDDIAYEIPLEIIQSKLGEQINVYDRTVLVKKFSSTLPKKDAQRWK